MNVLVARLLANLRRRAPYDDWREAYDEDTRRLPAKQTNVPDYYERSGPLLEPRRSE